MTEGPTCTCEEDPPQCGGCSNTGGGCPGTGCTCLGSGHCGMPCAESCPSRNQSGVASYVVYNRSDFKLKVPPLGPMPLFAAGDVRIEYQVVTKNGRITKVAPIGISGAGPTSWNGELGPFKGSVSYTHVQGSQQAETTIDAEETDTQACACGCGGTMRSYKAPILLAISASVTLEGSVGSSVSIKNVEASWNANTKDTRQFVIIQQPEFTWQECDGGE